jgi:hypothetical protein
MNPPDTQEKDEAGEIAKGVFNWYHTTRPIGGPTLVDKIEEALRAFAATRTAKLEARIAELEGALSKLIKLREHKRAFGKDESYVNLQPLVWSNAEKVLALSPTQDSQRAGANPMQK